MHDLLSLSRAGSCVLIVLATTLQSYAQQYTAAINTDSPNPNAVLHLVSPEGNQGLLIPSLTTNQRLGMSLSVEDNGLIVFDTERGLFHYWLFPDWIALIIDRQNLRLEGSELRITGGNRIDLGALGHLTTEEDPTVPAAIKDGIDWAELTGIPPDLTDNTGFSLPFSSSQSNESTLLEITNDLGPAASFKNLGEGPALELSGSLFMVGDTDQVIGVLPAATGLGNALFLFAGDATAAGNDGGDVVLQAGHGNGAGGAGGNIILDPGRSPNGSGAIVINGAMATPSGPIHDPMGNDILQPNERLAKVDGQGPVYPINRIDPARSLDGQEVIIVNSGTADLPVNSRGIVAGGNILLQGDLPFLMAPLSTLHLIHLESDGLWLELSRSDQRSMQ